MNLVFDYIYDITKSKWLLHLPTNVKLDLDLVDRLSLALIVDWILIWQCYQLMYILT